MFIWWVNLHAFESFAFRDFYDSCWNISSVFIIHGCLLEHVGGKVEKCVRICATFPWIKYQFFITPQCFLCHHVRVSNSEKTFHVTQCGFEFTVCFTVADFNVWQIFRVNIFWIYVFQLSSSAASLVKGKMRAQEWNYNDEFFLRLHDFFAALIYFHIPVKGKQ